MAAWKYKSEATFGLGSNDFVRSPCFSRFINSLKVLDNVCTDCISPLSFFQVLTHPSQWWMCHPCWASTGGNVHHPAPVVNTLRASTTEASGASEAQALKHSSKSQKALCTCLFESLAHSNVEVGSKTNSWSFVECVVEEECQEWSRNPILLSQAESECTQGTRGGVKELTDLIGRLWLEAAIKAETHVMGYGGHGDLA